LRAAKVIQDALAAAGLSMVVVGGSAVTAYDPDAYTSLDIDLVGPGLGVILDQVLCGELGFDRDGRHWYDEQLRITVERPASSLEPPGAEAVAVEVPGVGSIVVIAVEDLVCDRLASWAATGHYDSWAQAVRLARNDACDQERLEHRALDLKLDQYLLFGLWRRGRSAPAAAIAARLPTISIRSTRARPRP
jgi:hypothetical protein